MTALRDYWRLDAEIGWPDRIRILAAYTAVGLGFLIIGTVIAALVWPYTDVTFDGETQWKGKAPVVQVGSVADVTFLIPTATNDGHDIVFRRSLVQQKAPGVSYFEWPLGDPTLRNEGALYVSDDLPVRVVFPVTYSPGTYRIKMVAVYEPNFMSDREVEFWSPPLTVVDP
jgi:hypothetical protein